MFRLVVVFALSVLVVLTSLTAFGSVGAWTAGVVLAAIAAMWVPRGLPLPGAVMILLLVVPAASIVSPVRYAQDAARQAWCGTGQLRLAIENYHDSHGTFPPAFIADEDGRPMHSWRTLVLPYMEQHDLYDRYDFDEPWDGPNNRRLAAQELSIFRSPADRSLPRPGITNFVAVVGPETAWPGPRGRSEDEFAGRGCTLMFVETLGTDISWSEPRDLSLEELIDELAPEPTFLEWWLRLPPAAWRYSYYSPGRLVTLYDRSEGDRRTRAFVHGDLTPEAARALARLDVDSGPFLDALDGRDRVPAVLANVPVTEDAIRWAGFFTLVASALALLIAVRGLRRPGDQARRSSDEEPQVEPYLMGKPR